MGWCEAKPKPKKVAFYGRPAEKKKGPRSMPIAQIKILQTQIGADKTGLAEVCTLRTQASGFGAGKGPAKMLGEGLWEKKPFKRPSMK